MVKAIIGVMGNLNPHLRDVPDFQHKLWDQLFIMSVKFSTRSPNHEFIGPGIIGTKLPTMPIKHKIRPIISSNKSNIYFTLFL